MKASLVVFALGAAGTVQAGFYLPGVAPKSYELRENVCESKGWEGLGAMGATLSAALWKSENARRLHRGPSRRERESTHDNYIDSFQTPAHK